jgi:hypothetical protein
MPAVDWLADWLRAHAHVCGTWPLCCVCVCVCACVSTVCRPGVCLCSGVPHPPNPACARRGRLSCMRAGLKANPCLDILLRAVCGAVGECLSLSSFCLPSCLLAGARHLFLFFSSSRERKRVTLCDFHQHARAGFAVSLVSAPVSAIARVCFRVGGCARVRAHVSFDRGLTPPVAALLPRHVFEPGRP